MFSLFKKKREQPADENYFPFITDIHSHILPGIDDGSPDLQTSVALVKGLMQLGITESIATPHIIGDMYRNDATSINLALESLRTALTQNNIDFKLSVAAEYMLDAHFLELLADGPLLTLKEDLILTEFSYAARPANIEEMAFKIITEGYRPVLAHPERYGYFHNDLNMYHRLKDVGFLLQVNLLSLTSYYGKPAQKTAAYLLKHDLVSFAGTDLHHARHIDALTAGRSFLREGFGEKRMNGEFKF